MSAYTLRDIDNRGDNGEPYEFTGTADEVCGYIDGPLRGDLIHDRDGTLSEAMRLVTADDLDGANDLLRPMSVHLRRADK